MSNQSSENNKRIAKNTIYLYMRMVLLMGVSLFTSRVVLQALGVDDYGIYNVVGGIIVILSFLNNAMAGGTQRFLNVEMGRKDYDGVKSVFNTSIHIHLIVAATVLVIGETIGLWFLNTHMNIPQDRVAAANYVYQFSVATCLIGIISVPYNAAIISHEKMSAFAYISIIEGVLKLLVALAIYIYPFDKLIFYAFLMFMVGVVNRLIYGIYCGRHFSECRNLKFQIDKKRLRDMLSFSGWTIFGNLGYILHTQGIAIIVNMFFTVAVNAAQGIANQVNGIVNQFVSNFMTALNPQVVKSYAANELDAMHLLIFRGGKIAICMVSFFTIPIALEAETFLRLWLGVVPEYTVLFVRLVLLISLVNSISNLMATAKGATGNIKKYQITLTAVGALHLPLAWVAFELGCGPEYAMYVYLGIVVVLQAIRVWMTCNSIKLSKRLFIRKVILRCSTAMAVALVLPFMLHFSMKQSFGASIIVCIASVFTVMICTLYIAFDSQERKAVLKPMLKKINIK